MHTRQVGLCAPPAGMRGRYLQLRNDEQNNIIWTNYILDFCEL